MRELIISVEEILKEPYLHNEFLTTMFFKTHLIANGFDLTKEIVKSISDDKKSYIYQQEIDHE